MFMNKYEDESCLEMLHFVVYALSELYGSDRPCVLLFIKSPKSPLVVLQ